MTCPRCGFANPPGAAACESCGLAFHGRGDAAHVAPAAEGVIVGQKKGLAITSLVLGVMSVPLMCAFGLGLLTGLVALVLGIVALVNANRSPAEYGGKGLAIGGIVASGLCALSVPIIAAIAIPALLRARQSANEAATIGDIRTVISAEAAYSSANRGYYDTLECLGAPERCIPAYSGPAFLGPDLASGRDKSGYRRSFHPGASAGGERGASPSSVQSFAYVAVPLATAQTGLRGFCGDSSGLICVTGDGSPPPLADGACAPGCTPLP